MAGTSNHARQIFEYALSGRVWPSGRPYQPSEWDKVDSDFADEVPDSTSSLPDWSPTLLDDEELDCNAIRAALYYAEAHYKEKGYLDETAVIPIEGKIITGSLKCIGEEFALPLKFLNCTFQEGINLKDSHIRMIALQRCVIPFVSLKRAKVNGSVLIEGSQVHDGINMRAAEIKGAVALKGSSISNTNPKHRALDLRKAIVSASVFLRNGFTSQGVIDLSAADIHGDVDCGAANLQWKYTEGFTNTICLKGKNTNIGGSLFLNKELSAYGQIDFRRATIGARVNVEHCRLSVADDEKIPGNHLKIFALNLEHMTVQQDLSLKYLISLNGDIGLQNSDAKNFSDDPEAWLKEIHRYKGSIWLTGFRYNTLTTPYDPLARNEWMNKVLPQRERNQRFVRQPWEQMARVLRSLGQYKAADGLMIEAEKRNLKHNTQGYDIIKLRWDLSLLLIPITIVPRIITKLIILLYRFLVRQVKFGYSDGYFFIVSALAGLWCINVVVFGMASAHGRMKPVEEEIAVYMHWRELKQIPDSYVHFDTLIYSLDILLPIDLHQQSKWIPMMPHEEALQNEPKDVVATQLMEMRKSISVHESISYTSKFIPMIWSWLNILAGWTGFIMIGGFFAGTIRKSLEA